MEFRFSDADEAFRREVSDLIVREVPPEFQGGQELERSDDAAWAVARRFTKKLAERKWLAMAWPKEYGGLEATHTQQLIYNHEMAYYGAPGGGGMGVAWVGPAIMLYGTDEQKRTYLPRITNGDDVWCTLYSEPSAGSDLASLQTRAVRDGDDFVINGQKIWTSGGHRSNWGWLAARTDPDAPKHKGISTFVVDMQTPGITVRPLINIADQHSFNEVFFENVRIPKENLVGELNRGWYHVAVALDFERSGIAAYAGGRRDLERYVAFAKERPQFVRRSAMLRYQLADRWVELNVGYNLAFRITWMQISGKIPNYEASVSKLFGSELSQRIARTGMALLGPHAALRGGPHTLFEGIAAQNYLSTVSSTIAAGTSEVQRGIIAGRGLGLPRG